MDAFRRSPRGRFLRALRQLREIGYDHPAETARACYSRGFGDPRTAPDTTEIGRALAALNDIPGQDARDARAALSDLLVGEQQAAA
jgi:hypothetical protein